MQSYPLFPMPVDLMGRKPEEWSGREAKSYLEWILHVLDERVKTLLDYFQDDGSGSPEELLERLGERVAELLPSDRFSREPDRGVTIIEKSGRRLALPHPEGRTLTAEGYALAMDMGLLVAKLVLARGQPPYKWSVLRKPKSEIRYNHPVLVRTDGEDYFFGPMGASVASAHAILRGTHGPNQWRQMYEAI